MRMMIFAAIAATGMTSMIHAEEDFVIINGNKITDANAIRAVHQAYLECMAQLERIPSSPKFDSSRRVIIQTCEKISH